MKTHLFSWILVLSSLLAVGQDDPDYSLARSAHKIQGVYVFVATEPVQPHDYIATIKIHLTWSGLPSEAFEKAIKKAKRKYPYFNGIVFASESFSQADLIQFKGLEATGGGYRVGDKIVYYDKYKKKSVYGKIISLDNRREMATFETMDKYGEPDVMIKKYNSLSPITDVQYEEFLDKSAQEAAQYQFVIGEKIQWESSSALTPVIREGEVVDLDPEYKRATVKYTDSSGIERFKKIYYSKIIKMP